MPIKTCYRCLTEKPTDQFNACRDNRDGLRRDCRDCQRQFFAQWYAKNKERARKRSRDYGKTEHCKERRKRRYHEDSEYRAKRREQCRRSKQKASSREKDREWKQKKRDTDPQYRLRSNLSRRIRDVLLGHTKSASTMILIGCSTEEVRAHIEQQWLPGMNWSNYGVHGWHIDHIIPCAAFDLTRPDEQAKCFHYTNLQPLWALDNWRKSDWVPDYQI